MRSTPIMEYLFDISEGKHSKTATNCFKTTDFTAIKWFTEASGGDSDSKGCASMPGSIASIELVPQVFDAKQVDWPASFGL
jgi:hypothetical protein